MFPSAAEVAASIRPEPDQARSWLEAELRRAEYQPSIAERVRGWLEDLWESLSDTALGATALSAGVAIVLLVLFVVLLLLVAGQVRREPAARTSGELVVAGDQISPDGHRAAALAALDAGLYDRALLESFRALAARSVRRGLVAERPGLTAHELAEDLAAAFPAYGDQLRGASLRFDRVLYGHQLPSEQDTREVLALDDTLRTLAPASPATGLASAASAPAPLR